MWRIARLALVAAMLLAAYGSIGPAASEPPHIVPLARIDGWALTGATAQPTSHLVVAYDSAAARKIWRATRAARRVRRAGPGHGYGVYAGLDAVDFTRQAVLVLESTGSSSCPSSLLDVRPLSAGAIDLVTTSYRPEKLCTADLHAYTEIVAVDRNLLPSAPALARARMLVDGTRIGAVYVATGS
jgi:hypothetical protein